MQIARGDTGAGGLAGPGGLVGKDVPLVRWEDWSDLEDTDRALPIATVEMIAGVPNTGAPPMLRVTAQFDAWVLRNSEGLESRILDRLEAIMTSPAFASEGLDVAPTAGIRRFWSGFDDGRRRESLDMDFLLKL
jgi:hypothetical protein